MKFNPTVALIMLENFHLSRESVADEFISDLLNEVNSSRYEYIFVKYEKCFKMLFQFQTILH
jgi:hypothetical protein